MYICVTLQLAQGDPPRPFNSLRHRDSHQRTTHSQSPAKHLEQPAPVCIHACLHSSSFEPTLCSRRLTGRRLANGRAHPTQRPPGHMHTCTRAHAHACMYRSACIYGRAHPAQRPPGQCPFTGTHADAYAHAPNASMRVDAAHGDMYPRARSITLLTYEFTCRTSHILLLTSDFLHHSPYLLLLTGQFRSE